MLISHRHKFIFIKTFKTAGTSVEIALSKYCGPDDVITPIIPEDEAKRRELGYPGPQNDLVPLARYTPCEFARALYRRRRLRFTNHASAIFVRQHIDPAIWNSYFKFSFERNPWDRIVSGYYYAYPREPRPSLSEFVAGQRANTFGAFDLYTEDGEILVDQVYRFEALDAAMEDLRQRLNLPETPVLPRAKGGYRSDKRSYRDLLSAADRDKIARVYAREIAFFGYEF